MPVFGHIEGAGDVVAAIAAVTDGKQGLIRLGGRRGECESFWGMVEGLGWPVGEGVEDWLSG